MIRTLLIVLLLLAASLKSAAQRETDNWYFGDHASLEFNAAGTPVSFLNSAMNTENNSASISDRAGNLLFYTDGETVWNRLHQVMANGSGLQGSKMASQPAIIVPKPGSRSHYYIFTKTWGSWSVSNLSYSEVDITANNGMGEVLAATKNTPLLGYGIGYFDKITAVHHANHQDFWVITMRETVVPFRSFVAMKVTSAGIDPNPVFSNMPALYSYNTRGSLKASPVGKHLGMAYGHESWLLDFNDRNGQVSNPRKISDLNSLSENYSVEFSPDGSKLYLAGLNGISQFDISLNSTAAIIASRTTISPTGWPLQLASNGKIYVGTVTGPLMEIATPNAAGAASNFRPGPALVFGAYMRNGFPNFVQSYLAPPRFTYAGFCAENPTVFTIPDQTNIDSVRWHFGEPGAVNNTSTALQPNHIYNRPGVFTVQLSIYQQGFQSVFERDLTILNKPLVLLPKDTSLCEGRALYLQNAYPLNPFSERWRWSTGNTDSTILTVNKSGIYWLELTNGTCTTRDSIVVEFRKTPKVSLGPERLECGNVPIVLDAGNPGATYLWQPGGETTQTITATKPGVYGVTVTSNRCSVSSTVKVNFNAIPGFDFGEDITVCEGEPVVLKTLALNPGTLYSWSDSSRLPELKVTKSGKYWATVFYNGCTFTDTVTVTFKACPPPIVPYIPNIISPNHDNRNDKFVIEKIPPSSWSLKIYNRWGNQIYSNDQYNHSWPEKAVAAGTYFYLLEEPGTGRQFKGWLEVVQ